MQVSMDRSSSEVRSPMESGMSCRSSSKPEKRRQCCHVQKGSAVFCPGWVRPGVAVWQGCDVYAGVDGQKLQ